MRVWVRLKHIKAVFIIESQIDPGIAAQVKRPVYLPANMLDCRGKGRRDVVGGARIDSMLSRIFGIPLDAVGGDSMHGVRHF